MGNALWLILALPEWFFPSVLMPFAAGPLTLIPALGTVCLAIGIGLGVMKHKPALWLFLIPALFCEALVGIAGLFRGELRGSASEWALVAFLIFQLALCGYLVWRVRGARTAAVPLALFSLTYAMYAAFIASMAFSDSWM